MTDKFNVGDIVQLKSGGPKMTVTETFSGADENVRTSWFAGSKREAGIFPVLALLPVANDDPK